MIDKNLNYAYPLRFAEGGAVPDWVDPDYGYSPDHPRKPNMREMMEYMAGRTLEELHADPNSNVQDLSKQASSILYGVVGSNTDTRDFNKLMASIPRGDPQAAVKTIGAETRAMYGNQSRSQEELDKIQKGYDDANIRINPVSPGLAQVISFNPASNRYSSSLSFIDNQGVLLTGANPNTAASFGFTPEELDQARGQMIGESSLSQYYNAQPHNTLPPLGRIKPEPIIDYFDENGKRVFIGIDGRFPDQPVFGRRDHLGMPVFDRRPDVVPPPIQPVVCICGGTILPVFDCCAMTAREQLSNFPTHIVTGPDGVFDEQLSNDYRHLLTGPDGTRRTYSPFDGFAGGSMAPTYTAPTYIPPFFSGIRSGPVTPLPPTYTPPVFGDRVNNFAADTRAAGYDAATQRFANSPFVRPEGIASLQLGNLGLS
jgi:hypothetical protein